MANEKKTFEQSMKRLEEIVDLMESDKIEIEEKVTLYTEAMNLSSDMNLLLKDIEEKILKISEQSDGSIRTKEISESELTD